MLADKVPVSNIQDATPKPTGAEGTGVLADNPVSNIQDVTPKATEAEGTGKHADKIPVATIRRSLSDRSSSAGGARTMSPPLSLASLPSPSNAESGGLEDSQYAPSIHHFNSRGSDSEEEQPVEEVPARPPVPQVSGAHEAVAEKAELALVDPEVPLVAGEQHGAAPKASDTEPCGSSGSKGLAAAPDKALLREMEAQEEAFSQGQDSDEEALKNRQAFKARSIHCSVANLDGSADPCQDRAPLFNLFTEYLENFSESDPRLDAEAKSAMQAMLLQVGPSYAVYSC